MNPLATHSNVLVWRIPGMREPGGLPSMGSHRVGHDSSALAAAAANSVQSLSRLTPCNPMNSSRPGLPVHHHLPDFNQTHVHQVSDAIQPSYPLSSSSPPALNLSQYQGLNQMSRLSSSGGQSIGVSASTSVLQMNTQD